MPQYTDELIRKYRKDVGETIRLFRERKGCTQDELAQVMEIHSSTIDKVEKGKFAFSIDYLTKFAWHLDFDIMLVGKPVNK